MPLSRRFHLMYLRYQVVVLLLVGQKAAALERVQAMLQLQPDHLYALTSRALLLSQLGQADASIHAMQTLVETHPSNAPGWFNLGYMLNEHGQTLKAEAAFRRAPGCMHRRSPDPSSKSTSRRSRCDGR